MGPKIDANYFHITTSIFNAQNFILNITNFKNSEILHSIDSENHFILNLRVIYYFSLMD